MSRKMNEMKEKKYILKTTVPIVKVKQKHIDNNY